ncbi:DUF2637 domain-containing protein [Micromonospora sp. DR5-3]|uniref:DUF2637 domain-containing protein n=1 Tax=unclassified Micromonospora TaxID=2617518 RepID=UPI0011D7A28F|nr:MULTISPECIES: DUF2637 domain-containing protein [unclassified Micromonospora]MCW3815711.1 DUF2637 domain-containing protein [Micromonospora sp. DR5-3]TYC23865.1 DUF2637 domain-containing protein [Micromonospora sp. MP36]
MKPHPTHTRAERVEGLVLVVILLLVAGFAGAASFTHVKDWTLDNSPPGTGAWFGWANAVISELVPVAALLTIRRRRRTGGPIGYPMFLLVAAVALSLAAQLAVAKPGLSGWLLSAVPALAFMGLSKLILATTPTPADEPVHAPAPPVATPPARPVEPPAPPVAPTPTPAPAAPVALVPVEPARPAPVAPAPVPSTAFVRRNGTPLTREVTR